MFPVQTLLLSQLTLDLDYEDNGVVIAGSEMVIEFEALAAAMEASPVLA